jgi:hypothetical protein
LARPILSLWPYLWRAFLHSGLLIVALLLQVVLVSVVHAPSAVVCAGAFVSILFWRGRSGWHWRLIAQVRRFRTVSDDRVVLHYAPELHSKWNMQVLLERCHAELDRLVDQFGSPLRGRTAVFLFASHQEFGGIFGPGYGGTALLLANAIVIADDTNIQEMLRHEFAHLFSGRWNRQAPPLLSEGLSVWLQETSGRQPIERVARPLLGNRGLKLPLLLDPTFFFAEHQRHACYLLAGSFTGFLMRRYGWKQYRKLYRQCDGVQFGANFEKCLGVTLEKAEWQWRNELIVLEIMNRRLGRDVCL